MTDRLGHKQIAAMLALMVIAREVSNPELEEIVGFTLTGEDRRKLNGLKFVTSVQRGRPYFHELTELGWAWCEEELVAGEPPAPRTSLGRTLYVILGGLDKYLRQGNLRLADVFAPSGTPSGEVNGTANGTANGVPSAADIEDRIRVAYRKLARTPRDWVGLVDLRPLLGDAPTEKVDAVLKELSRSGQVYLVPDSNRKALTKVDHDAAIRVGGEDNHLLSIEVS